MATLGAAVGMLVGATALAIALWEVPRLRRTFFSDYQGFILAFSVTLVLGGWVGYSIFAALFHR